MIKIYYIFLIIIFLLNISCTKKIEKENLIKEKELNSQVFEAYSQGKQALIQGDVIFAAKKFNEAEILFPQSEWAPKSALMAAYAYYSQDYYNEATAELERFLKIYPSHQNKDYAYYILALSYYEQIADEKKDLQSIIKAKDNFLYLIDTFPNTNYAQDSKFKLDLINDILASKEMYIGRYYFEKKKWIAAINRFKTVINDYDETIYTEEALHRLVEVYYTIGLKSESIKYAKLLGYNYQSSIWYEKSYSYFDDKYEINKKNINQKKSMIKKFKSLF